MQSDRPSSRAVIDRSTLRPVAACIAGLLVLAVQLAAAAQGPQPAPNANAAAASAAASSQRAATTRAAGGRTDARPGPTWTELSKDQQTALQPLASRWNTLSEAQKRKWLAMSANFRQMGPLEQSKLHSRMNDWVALSPQQRTQARLNFAETKNLSADDKKAKWEAYQALSPDEKHKLAAGAAAARTPPTAAAVRPVPPQKLANLPHRKSDGKAPRIATGPAPHAQPGGPSSQTN